VGRLSMALIRSAIAVYILTRPVRGVLSRLLAWSESTRAKTSCL
jgi:hypothetical protein